MAREPIDLKHTLGREGASIEGGHGPTQFDRARFLKMGAAVYVGALLGGNLVMAEGAGPAVAEPASGEGLYDEPFRGQFHFSPKKNWTNDPNGLVYYRGEYHLFFQYNPYGDTWGNISWGHAVSPDMLRWEQLPVALRPDELGYIFSGSAVVDENDTSGFFDGGSGMVAIYTNADGKDYEKQVQSIAYSRCRASPTALIRAGRGPSTKATR